MVCCPETSRHGGRGDLAEVEELEARAMKLGPEWALRSSAGDGPGGGMAHLMTDGAGETVEFHGVLLEPSDVACLFAYLRR